MIDDVIRDEDLKKPFESMFKFDCFLCNILCILKQLSKEQQFNNI